MYKLNKYPDGSTYINGIDIEPVTFRINGYDDLWYLNQYVDAFNSKYDFPPNITIPNILDGQADRRFHNGESTGLKLVCNFLNSLNVKKYYIFHPHNPEVVEALIDNVEILDNTKFIENVIESLRWKHDVVPNPNGSGYGIRKDHISVLMSSDAGGFKPLMKLCDKIQWGGKTYSATKSRKYEKGESKLIQLVDKTDFHNRDILIVDDISVFGGTFKGLAKLLRERNAGKLYLAVSHMTIQNQKPNPKDPEDKVVFDYFDKVFTTNSKFDNYFIPFKKKNGGVQPKNLEVIKLFDI